MNYPKEDKIDYTRSKEKLLTFLEAKENAIMVSLCRDKVEIEGKAEILGLMTSEENKNILEILRKKQPNAVKRWENKPNMVIVTIQPTFAAIDGYYIGDDAYVEYIDFKKEIAYRLKWGYD